MKAISGMPKTGTSVQFLVVEAKEIGRHFVVTTIRKRWKTLCARVLLLSFFPLETVIFISSHFKEHSRLLH